MIQLIALDLDGTTITKDHTLTQNTKKAINAAREKGIRVMVATGRSVASSRSIVKELGLHDYLLTGNGAHVMKKEQILFETYYKPELAEHIFNEMRKLGLKTVAAHANGMLIESFEGWHAYYQNADSIDFQLFSDVNMHDYHIMKFLGLATPDVLKKASEHLSNIEGVDVTSSAQDNLEVNLQGINKKTGLDFVIKDMGISWDNVMVCGDNFNDLEMILAAKIGVAMGNGRDDVKAQADFVTKSNDEDGVAFAIEHLIFQN